jgi:hypothetical protein
MADDINKKTTLTYRLIQMGNKNRLAQITLKSLISKLIS